jgi:hypothetical protein
MRKKVMKDTFAVDIYSKETKFDVELDDGNGNVRLVGDYDGGGDVYISNATRNGKDVRIWNKRIGYTKSALRLEGWEKLIRNHFNLDWV